MIITSTMLFPDGRVNPSEIGYSPDGPLTKLIKPKCPNTSHMYTHPCLRRSTYPPVDSRLGHSTS